MFQSDYMRLWTYGEEPIEGGHLADDGLNVKNATTVMYAQKLATARRILDRDLSPHVVVLTSFVSKYAIGFLAYFCNVLGKLLHPTERGWQGKRSGLRRSCRGSLRPFLL
jgi:hypothetical protein